MHTRTRLRMYIDGVLAPQTRYTFTPEQRHRAQTVLHLRAGDPFTVFDRECKEYRAELLNPAGSFQTGDVQRALQADGVKGVRLSLVFSPLKHDRTTNVLEKATEVGVSRFAPALCQRSVVTRVNLDKWKRTTVEAAEQSDRLSLPSLVPMAPLDKQVDQLQQVSPRALLLLVDEAAPLAADTQPIVQTLVELVKKNAEVQDVVVVVGPEGGISPHERDLMHQRGAIPVSLGRSILRSDTACIVSSFLVRSCFPPSAM